MKFQYKKFNQATNQPVIRPVIPIEVKNGDQSIRYEALIDSGADVCIFHYEIGELIGLNVEDGVSQRVSGITEGEEIYYVHPISIIVGGWEYKITAGFKKLSGISYGVLGQVGFFNLFSVKFDYLKGNIELSEKRAIA